MAGEVGGALVPLTSCFQLFFTVLRSPAKRTTEHHAATMPTGLPRVPVDGIAIVVGLLDAWR